jgi:folate-binding protein YgfZ
MNSPFGLIQFKGDQTLKVLQGQCTQMVIGFNAKHAPLIAFCDPKGRMFGSGRLLQYNNLVSLITPIDQSDVLLKRLHPFLTLSRVSAAFTEIPVSLAAHSSLSPAVCQHKRGTTLVGEFGGTQWQVGDRDQPHDPKADIARLSAGLGFVRQGSSDLLIPQQAHYQMLGGVNFKKGCYTGQEVIARLEHLGQAKKYLYIYRETPVYPGRSVELEGTSFKVFDAANDHEDQAALLLAPVSVNLKQLTHVPLKITRQVEGQRPVKL